MTTTPAPRRPVWQRTLAAALCLAIAWPAGAVTSLANQPIASNVSVPGNLALPLSVEFPTAVSVAHVDNTYVSTTEFLGYFDPNKCYLYKTYTVETATDKDHFYPAALATNRTCTGANDQMWSGNFLNWATMQTIDPFRWVLTGGYRVVDTASTTLLEKAWASGQGGASNFPLRYVTDTTVLAGATPFTTSWVSRIDGMGDRILMNPAGVTSGLLATYFNNKTLTGTPALTRFETVDFNWGNGSPGTGVNADNFSARWSVTSVAPTTGNYKFQTVSDDGVRVWINGTLVIDNWTDHGPTTNTSNNIALTAGDTLKVTVEYYEAGGGTEIRLRWLPPGAGAYTVYTPSPDTRNNTTPPNPQMYVRVKVCDSSVGLEANCVAYANGNYKPEGLMQQYAKQIRYSVFGYLNDDNIQRDGGVLRAQQKFVGPTYPVPGAADATNAAAEWSATTGVFVTNPDNITSALGQTISDSGALNYVNKFGQVLRGNYKTYDPVGELYYTALRYYKNLGNIDTWTAASGTGSTNKTWADGFPVITSWNDPIQYSCQKNFILGIGDVNSHADKNVPGGTGTANEPAKPGGLADDPFNANTATNQIGVIEPTLSDTLGTVENYNGCCNNNSALMAGLAYHANVLDIRPTVANKPQTVGKQTVTTYWMDVLEYQTYKANNQYYLAAKYGGFAVPTDYDPGTRTTELEQAWWHTPGPVEADNYVGSGNNKQLRPNNYYTASKPSQVVKGLTAAFADIASKISAYSSAIGTAQPQVTNTGNASYAANYYADRWSGDVIASELSFTDGTGDPELSEKWRFSNRLAEQANGTGWDTKRRIVTWDSTAGAAVPFRIASLSTSMKSALDTSYVSGDDSTNYLNYLRGDRSKEIVTGGIDTGRVYRERTSLVGDITGSRVLAVAGPSLNLSDATNPGYSAFKSGKASRKRMLYVGANDGMLHAIDGAIKETDSATYGQEVFAYVPGVLYQGPSSPATPNVDGLAALGKPAYVHRNFVNATPTVTDIDFSKTQGATGATNWRSVLIGGLGKGGKAYYAIDITDPTGFGSEDTAKTKVLWEFSHADLGYTYGDPAVVKTEKYGWVVIIASGYNNTDGKGYFFILNPRTGALLEKIGTGSGSVAEDAGMAHVSAYVLDRTDGYADAAYAGDLQGNVWRLDLTGTDAYDAPIKIATLKDKDGAVQPITSRADPSIDPANNLRHVLVGTGRYLDSTDVTSAQVQTFYSIRDGNTVRFADADDLPSGVTFPITRSNLAKLTDPQTGVTLSATQVGWYYELGLGGNGYGYRVISPSATFLGTVAFASFLPSASDPCSPSGSSRIYALNFGTGETRLGDEDTPINYEETNGLVTDLLFLSVDGRLQLIAGTDLNEVVNLPIRKPAPSLKKLNWREITLTN